MLRWFQRVGDNLYVTGRVSATGFGMLVYLFFVVLGCLGIAALIYAVI